MKEFVLQISGRKIVNMLEFRHFFNELKDGKHLLTIKDLRKRSVSQNAYYWGVMVPIIKKALYDAGYDEVTTNEDAHEVIKHLLLKKRIVSKQTGDVIDISTSTTKLSISEFNEFIERVCRWAAEFLGTYIPSPNEEMVMFTEKLNDMEY
jgi:hypothetical protein